jgi:archaemetzincin
MCGSNHRDEADRRPLWLCPECMAKVCWATRTDPLKRYESLREFCREAGLADAETFYARSMAALSPPGKHDTDSPETSTPQDTQSQSPAAP